MKNFIQPLIQDMGWIMTMAEKGFRPYGSMFLTLISRFAIRVQFL